MANVMLKCLVVAKYGRSTVLPIIGETQIPADGSAFEVPEEVAKILIEGGNKNYRIEGDEKPAADKGKKKAEKANTGSKKDKKADKVEENEDDSDEDEDSEEDDNDEDGDDPLANIDQLELPELIEIAKTLELPEKDWTKFSAKKNLMVAYLKKQNK